LRRKRSSSDKTAELNYSAGAEQHWRNQTLPAGSCPEDKNHVDNRGKTPLKVGEKKEMWGIGEGKRSERGKKCREAKLGKGGSGKKRKHPHRQTRTKNS